MSYLQRNKALSRRTALKRSSKPIRRAGKKTLSERPIKKALLDNYFSTYGWDEDGEQWANCQICGNPMRRRDANACHKQRASDTGKCTPKNILAAHGFQWREANCHSWMDARASRYSLGESDPANVSNGEVIKWSEPQSASLVNFLKTQTDKLQGP